MTIIMDALWWYVLNKCINFKPTTTGNHHQCFGWREYQFPHPYDPPTVCRSVKSYVLRHMKHTKCVYIYYSSTYQLPSYINIVILYVIIYTLNVETFRIVILSSSHGPRCALTIRYCVSKKNRTQYYYILWFLPIYNILFLHIHIYINVEVYNYTRW